MLQSGEWIATATPSNDKIRSYHLNGLYSPFLEWREIVQQHQACGDDPSKLQVFHNTVLGKDWIDAAAIPLDPHRIMARASSWGTKYLPDEVCLITAGVDVQSDRVELQIMGYGAGEESWSLDYLSLPGAPSDPELWTHLDETLRRRLPHRKLGELGISIACIDSGNWSRFCLQFHGSKIPPKNLCDQRIE